MDLSIEAIENWARGIETANDLPLSVAPEFVGPSRFIGETSDALLAEEKRRAVHWVLLHRWLDRVHGTDLGGSMPTAAQMSEWTAYEAHGAAVGGSVVSREKLS